MNRALQAFPSVDTPPAPEPPASVVVNGLGDELLTVNDAARFLHVTVSWVYEHTRDDAEDRLPFVKLGKYVRFDSIDAQGRRRSGVPEQVRRTSPRIEAAGARATTGGGTCGARARDVASVPPHSFVAAQRSPRAGEDRAGATRAREHPDDAQHLHARRR